VRRRPSDNLSVLPIPLRRIRRREFFSLLESSQDERRARNAIPQGRGAFISPATLLSLSYQPAVRGFTSRTPASRPPYWSATIASVPERPFAAHPSPWLLSSGSPPSQPHVTPAFLTGVKPLSQTKNAILAPAPTGATMVLFSLLKFSSENPNPPCSAFMITNSDTRFSYVRLHRKIVLPSVIRLPRFHLPDDFRTRRGRRGGVVLQGTPSGKLCTPGITF